MRVLDIFFLNLLALIVGILSGMSLSVSMIGVIGSLFAVRFFWIDDNIHNDLMRAAELPIGYRNTQIRRANWSFKVLGVAPSVEEDPLRMALRLKMHSNGCLIFGSAMTASALTVHAGGIFFDTWIMMVALMVGFNKIDANIRIARELQRQDRPDMSSAHLISHKAVQLWERTVIQARRKQD